MPPDTSTNTQSTSTLPSHVATMTIIAQVVGYIITTFGGLLTTYQALHAASAWPGAVIAAMGVLLTVVTHFGYVKGQAITQNAIVDSILRVGGPAAAIFIATLMQKGPVNDAIGKALGVITGQGADPVTPPPVAPLAPPSSWSQVPAVPPTSPK